MFNLQKIDNKNNKNDKKWKCTICYEKNKYPMILQCGHTFCNECIEKINRCSLCNESKILTIKNFSLSELCGIQPNTDKYFDEMMNKINNTISARNIAINNYHNELIKIIFNTLVKELSNIGALESNFSFAIESKIIISSDTINELKFYINKFINNNMITLTIMDYTGKNIRFNINLEIDIKKIKLELNKPTKIDNIIENILEDRKTVFANFFDFILCEMLKQLETNSLNNTYKFYVPDNYNCENLIVLANDYIKKYNPINNLTYFNISQNNDDQYECEFKIKNVIEDKNIISSLNKKYIKNINNEIVKREKNMIKHLDNIYFTIFENFLSKLNDNIYEDIISYVIEIDGILNDDYLKIIENNIKQNIIPKLKHKTNFGITIDEIIDDKFTKLSIIFELILDANIINKSSNQNVEPEDESSSSSSEELEDDSEDESSSSEESEDDPEDESSSSSEESDDEPENESSSSSDDSDDNS